MATPARRSRVDRRWGVALLVAVAALVAVVVLVRDDAARAAPLPPLPTGRDDVELDLDVRRIADGVEIDLVLGVAAGADRPLRIRDWSSDAAGGDHDDRWWHPAVLGERLPQGQVVIHLGRGLTVRPTDGYYMAGLVSDARDVDPGEQVEVGLELEPDRMLPQEGEPVDDETVEPLRTEDLEQVDEVRVCVWGDGWDDPGARPAVCADAPI